MLYLSILLAACILDLLLGDPSWYPHPVRIMGWTAARTEAFARGLPLSERTSGRLTVHVVLFLVCGACAALLSLLSLLPQPFLLSGAAFLLYTAIAARDLMLHALRVHAALGSSVLESARQQVAFMVGRDTDQMDEAGIVRACVESVAENMSDGIVAPLFWATAAAAAALPAGGVWPAACGAVGAMLYKAINTMDSMFGYKNERYLHFGTCPARLDDMANFLPARMSSLAIVLAAPVCMGSLSSTWRILLRDRLRHSSPNSGWPEAAAAGALGIQLGGASSYFGQLVCKPTLGDPQVPPERHHILLACRLVLTASLLCLLVFAGVFFLLHFFGLGTR